MRIVLHPPIIITIVITITSPFLLSILGQVVVYYLVVSGHLDLALLLLHLDLCLGCRLLQLDVLLSHLLVALVRHLEGLLDKITTSCF